MVYGLSQTISNINLRGVLIMKMLEITKKIDSVYNRKMTYEESFLYKFDSEEELKSISCENLKAIHKYYETKVNDWRNKYTALVTSFGFVFGALIGAAFAVEFKRNPIPFSIIAFVLSIAVFYCFNIVPRHYIKICSALSYVIAQRGFDKETASNA